MIFPKAFSFVLLVQLLALSSSQNLVQAADYSFTTPTAATRWVAGQPALVTIVSTDKAKSAAPSNDRLLSITLNVNKGIFQPNSLVATIKDHVQLLVPFGSTQTQVSLSINDFVIPANVPAGDKYFVTLKRYDSLFDQETVKSPTFQIVAAPQPPPGGNTTTGPTQPTPTNTSLLPTQTANTTTVAPTPTSTLPAGQTCNDVKEQCAAQGKAYVEATNTEPCACGAASIVPIVVGSGASSTIQSTTGGPTAALVVLLLVVMTLF
ncbi:hypothetical protein BGX27_003328 [Mortierella sp. AM989]|nr:hypothetical protein BGX27_003328 [Mortierella sp. AM989]